VTARLAPPGLTAEEERLVLAMRDVPDSPLKTRLAELVSELALRVAHPCCPEAQADGVPCDSAGTACDECRRGIGFLDRLARGVRAG